MATQRRNESSATDRPIPAGVVQNDTSSDSAPSRQPTRRRASARSEAESTQQAQGQRGEISNEARYMMIQQAAYLRAERRGFEPGFELDDWLAAENEVDTLLGASHGNSAAQ
jgi:hypothetical protein